MQRPIMLCAFASLLFAAGLLAGQGLQSTSSTQPLAAESPSGDSSTSLSVAAQTNFSSGLRVPVTSVSHETGFSDAPSLGPTPEPEPQFFAMASDDGSVSDSPLGLDADNSRKVHDLIRRIFPNTSPEVLEAWAEAYENMDPAEVEFILDQKRLLSESLDSPIFGDPISDKTSVDDQKSADTFSVFPSPLLRSPLTPADSESASAFRESAATVESALLSVRRNLDSAWCIGFHRTVVLPEVLSAANPTVGGHMTSFKNTTFTSFEPGRIIKSPMPLHVALQSKNGAFMFRLEGDQFTRRGDFQLLRDRRIGLCHNGTDYALSQSMQLPEEAVNIHFSADGTIDYEDASSQLLSAGQLEIFELPQLDQLTTVDGVIFTSTSGKPAAFVSGQVAILTIRSLELSNVDREEESALLLHLEKAASDLKRAFLQTGPSGGVLISEETRL